MSNEIILDDSFKVQIKAYWLAYFIYMLKLKS